MGCPISGERGCGNVKSGSQSGRRDAELRRTKQRKWSNEIRTEEEEKEEEKENKKEKRRKRRKRRRRRRRRRKRKKRSNDSRM